MPVKINVPMQHKTVYRQGVAVRAKVLLHWILFCSLQRGTSLYTVTGHEFQPCLLLHSSKALQCLPLRKDWLQVVQHLPRTWRLMLLTFGSAVSLYQLAGTGLVTADVVSGQWQSPGTRDIPSDLPFDGAEPLHVATLQSCQECALQVISSWR